MCHLPALCYYWSPPPAGKCTHTVQTKGENINLCWSPNGQAIAVGNKEDVITIIDTKSYKIILEEQFKYEVRLSFGGKGVRVGGARSPPV